MFVDCAEGIVYNLPLNCGTNYFGQSGRCLNDRLREHRYNVIEMRGGFLDAHCRNCMRKKENATNKSMCSPVFSACSIVSKRHNQLTREIIKAESIDRLGDTCVSKQSVALSRKHLCLLRKDRNFRRAAHTWCVAGYVIYVFVCLEIKHCC